MQKRRQERATALIRKLAASFFEKTAGLPGVVFSVTRVEVSDDLQNAKIFLSVFPENKQKDILKQLNSLLKEFREYLSCNLKTKFVPWVILVIDDSLEKQKRIEGLLDSLK